MQSAAGKFLLFLAALFYLCFLTQSYFWDGVLFSYNIEQVHAGAQPFAVLFQPNHLLYSPFGYVLYAAAQAVHLHVRAITLLQLWNSLVAVAIGWRLYLCVRKQVNDKRAALLCLLLLVFGATWWKYATDADSYIIAGLMFLLAVLFALEPKPRLAYAAACHIAAMLFHELAIFAYAPVVAAIWFSEQPLRTRLRSIAVYVVATAVSVTAVYYACYRIGAARYTTFAHWITTYASDTTITRTPRQLLTEYIVSYGKLFAGGKFTAIRDFFSFWTVLGLLVCATGLFAFFVPWRKPSDEQPQLLDVRTRRVLWAWILPLAAFLAWFDPGNAAHKLFLWPPIVMLIATAAWSQRHVRALIALSVALAGWNFAGYIYPHSRPDGDPVVAFAHRLARELPQGAKVYYAAFSPDDWYLAYLAPNSKWLPLRQKDLSGSICYETTALAANPVPPFKIQKTWTLTAKGRNIHVACLVP